MNAKRRNLKVFGVILIILGFLVYGFYIWINKNLTAKKEYPEYIGKIELQDAIFTEGFTLCKSNKKPVGFYHSSAPWIYKTNKLVFKEMIMKNFQNTDKKNHGYLSLRFNINCKGEIGNLVLTELDLDLKVSKLNNKLVDQLVRLSLRKENWQIPDLEGFNYYMYLLFKIENGKVTEILP